MDGMCRMIGCGGSTGHRRHVFGPFIVRRVKKRDRSSETDDTLYDRRFRDDICPEVEKKRAYEAELECEGFWNSWNGI